MLRTFEHQVRDADIPNTSESIIRPLIVKQHAPRNLCRWA